MSVSAEFPCPAWCSDHRHVAYAGQVVEFHVGVFFVQPAPAVSAFTSAVVVRVSQACSCEGAFRATCSIQTWEDPPVVVDVDRLRELAGALERAAVAVESAGGRPAAVERRLRLVT